jgi:hypothetical protein
MSTRLTAKDGKIALHDHVVQKAHEARARHGALEADGIVRLLDDRAVVRYPIGVRFDAEPLEPGEFAWPKPLGDHPSAGYCLFVHPCFENRPETWPLLIAYHIPSVNYGDIVSHEEAEAFGAALLGMDVDDYYRRLCALADAMPPEGA